MGFFEFAKNIIYNSNKNKTNSKSVNNTVYKVNYEPTNIVAKAKANTSTAYKVNYAPTNVLENKEFENDKNTIRESMEIIKTTLNPIEFFENEFLASNTAVRHLNNSSIVWNNMNCRQIYNMLYDRYEANMIHREFIDRLFSAGCEDELTYQMYDAGYKLYPETRIYFLKKLNGKKYHFCNVSFPESKKTYTYVTRDPSISPGDMITVPVGNGFVPESKPKQVISVFEASLDKLNFPIERLRCVDGKLVTINCPNCGASIKIDSAGKTGLCQYCQTGFYLIRLKKSQ